jgi:hypothetical protein
VVHPSLLHRDPPRCWKVWALSLQKELVFVGGRTRPLTRRHADGPEHIVPVREHTCDCCSTNAGQNLGLSSRLQPGLAKPSVPSRNVANFSSSAPICVASAPLSSFNCFKFSSSDLLAAIRAAKTDDCCAFWEPMLGCRNEEPAEDPDGNVAVGRGAYAISIACDPVRKGRFACVEFR